MNADPDSGDGASRHKELYLQPFTGPLAKLGSRDDTELYHALQALTLDGFTLLALLVVLPAFLLPLSLAVRIPLGAAGLLSLVAALMLRIVAVSRTGDGEDFRLPLLGSLIERELERIRDIQGENDEQS